MSVLAVSTTLGFCSWVVVALVAYQVTEDETNTFARAASEMSLDDLDAVEIESDAQDREQQVAVEVRDVTA